MIDEEFKEKITTTQFKNYLPVLKYLKNHPRSTQIDAQKAVNYSAGKIYRVVKDAKLLGLVHNGYGLSLTELGDEWRLCTNKKFCTKNRDFAQKIVKIKYISHFLIYIS